MCPYRIYTGELTNVVLVIGGLLGTQNGREVEIVNTFELAMDDEEANKVDHGFLTSRKEQCMRSIICPVYNN
jgi:hypothetical protein